MREQEELLHGLRDIARDGSHQRPVDVEEDARCESEQIHEVDTEVVAGVDCNSDAAVHHRLRDTVEHDTLPCRFGNHRRVPEGRATDAVCSSWRVGVLRGRYHARSRRAVDQSCPNALAPKVRTRLDLDPHPGELLSVHDDGT